MTGTQKKVDPQSSQELSIIDVSTDSSHDQIHIDQLYKSYYWQRPIYRYFPERRFGFQTSPRKLTHTLILLLIVVFVSVNFWGYLKE